MEQTLLFQGSAVFTDLAITHSGSGYILTFQVHHGEYCTCTVDSFTINDFELIFNVCFIFTLSSKKLAVLVCFYNAQIFTDTMQNYYGCWSFEIKENFQYFI